MSGSWAILAAVAPSDARPEGPMSAVVVRFDAAALHAALDARRRARGLSWGQVAAECGVSATTLTRTARGGRLELDGALCMVGWLGLPVETFLRDPTGEPPDLLAQVATLLRARSDLSPAGRAELEAIIRDAYLRLSSGTPARP